MTDLGLNIQPDTDEIAVATATFPLLSENKLMESVYCLPDSFLLGRYNDPTFGTLKADILTQFTYPQGYVYPETTTPDSVLLVLYYRTWFGSDDSPMNIRVFEMNKKTLEAGTKYYSNTDPEEFTDYSVELLNEIVKAKDPHRVNGDSISMVFKLPATFLTRFYPGDKAAEVYASDEAFYEFFKGLYVTTDYGSSTLLNLNHRMELEFYYHYTRESGGEVVDVPQLIRFVANTEVKRVNRYEYAGRDRVEEELTQHPEYHYLASPGNIFTKIRIPIREMKEKMNVGKKTLDINLCHLRIDVVENEKTETGFTQPLPGNLLLVKESEYDNIFLKNMPLLPDTTGVIATYSYNSTLKEGFYSFKLPKLIANEIRKATDNNTELPEYLDMILLPAGVRTSGVNYYVSHSCLLSSAVICSAVNPDRRMMLRVIYSGY
ncbi:MAG: DUF4270 domain-containing protein [Prevotellaceae bacterium]|jgi:hypothetical protein|nr:DUF4270 domain-containing protein [Prevotellaceae bacterium]